MDPTTTCCPPRACPASGPSGQGTMGLHARKDTRFLGTECPKPCSATQGPGFSRLRTSAETVRLVGTVLAHGWPLQALIVALGSEARTGADGVARGGDHGQAGQEPLVEPPRALGPGQAEESRVQTQGGLGWRALALRGKTRVWRGGAVRAQRARPRRRRRRARGRRGAARRPRLGCPEGVGSSLRAMREPWRAPLPTGTGGRPRRRRGRQVLIAQGVKRDARQRVVDTARRRGEGTPARVATLRRRSPGNGGIHTASLERRNAPVRARRASLTRRGRARARRTLTLQHGLSLLGTVAHVCTPPARLAHPGRGTPPAMAAGLTDHGWTVQARLSWPIPPPRWTPPQQRGRPAPAFKRLMARWCGDHG